MSPRYVLPLVLCLLSAPVFGEEKKGQLNVVCVGVEPTLSAKGKNDPYARDAGHVGDALQKAAPFYDKVNVTVVSGAEATRDAVAAALGNMARQQGPKDVAVIFFSSHGMYTPADGYTISLAKNGKVHTLLKGEELWRGLAATKGRVVVLLDTCCAAGALPPNKNLLPHVSFLTACRANEGSSGSGSSKNEPHGCFVVALVEALAGKADANNDGQVTFAEICGYVPGRAKEQYNEQNAVGLARPTDAALVLAKVDVKAEAKPAANQTAAQAPATPAAAPPVPTPEEPKATSRNPFGMPDVRRPFSKEVAQFAKATPTPGAADDANAAEWGDVAVPKAESIEGRWAGRWNSGEGDWSTGMATVKMVDDKVYIMYHDGGGRYLIEARRMNKERLVGRYVNVSDEADTSPWVGRIVADDRIDGYWPSGRWDLRRTWEK